MTKKINFNKFQIIVYIGLKIKFQSMQQKRNDLHVQFFLKREINNNKIKCILSGVFLQKKYPNLFIKQ